MFEFAANLMNGYEWAGATFSPDGQTLFANIQGGQGNAIRGGGGGMTFAIWGPWDEGAL